MLDSILDLLEKLRPYTQRQPLEVEGPIGYICVVCTWQAENTLPSSVGSLRCGIHLGAINLIGLRPTPLTTFNHLSIFFFSWPWMMYLLVFWFIPDLEHRRPTHFQETFKVMISNLWVPFYLLCQIRNLIIFMSEREMTILKFGIYLLSMNYALEVCSIQILSLPLLFHSFWLKAW